MTAGREALTDGCPERLSVRRVALNLSCIPHGFPDYPLIVRHTFTPHNNTRLSHLCGPMDAHLRSIEAGLQVSIAHRHEQFKVDGPKAQAQRAMELLQALYERADRPIAADMVQLMLAGDSALGEDADGTQTLHTRRADLKARTPGQSVYMDNIAGHDITFGIGPAGTGTVSYTHLTLPTNREV